MMFVVLIDSISGAMGALFASTIFYPLDNLRIRLSAKQSGESTTKSNLMFIKHVI